MRSTRVVSCLAVFGAVFPALLLSSGCSHYNNYTENPEPDRSVCTSEAPDWVKRGVSFVDEDGGGKGAQIYFVGRSVGYTALDERGAYNAAMDHAREQLALVISGRIHADATAIDHSRGIRHNPDEKWDLKVYHDSYMKSDALVGELLERQVYWERWDVREEPFPPLWFGPAHKHVKRYKCWVLATISRDRLDRLAEETRTMHVNEALLQAAGQMWKRQGKLSYGSAYLADPKYKPSVDVLLNSSQGYRLSGQ